MPRQKSDGPTRQIFANIKEDLYIKVKSKAAEQRLSMRDIIEKSFLPARFPLVALLVFFVSLFHAHPEHDIQNICNMATFHKHIVRIEYSLKE